MGTLTDKAVAVSVSRAAIEHRHNRDPLAVWRFAVPRLREALALFADDDPIDELHLRACNKGTKALRDDEPVLTPTGWVAISDLRAGDLVASRDGSFCSVVGVYPQGEKPILRLTFSDGSFSLCSPDHLWVVKDRSARFSGGPERVVTAGELEVARHATDRIAVPGVGCVYYPERALPLEPYLLGALLGDGCVRGRSVRLSCADIEIADRVKDNLPSGCRLTRFDSPGRCPDWHVQGNPNIVREALVELSLQGCMSWEKFIPDIYLRSCEYQRRELLAGLMDTDGTADARGHCSFTSTSERMARQVLELVQLLGGMGRIKSTISSYNIEGRKVLGRTSWRVSMRLPFNPFRLPRKVARWIPPSRSFDRVLMSIKSEPPASCTCIAVDHPSKTFVTRGGLVTHNTETVAAYVLACLQKRNHLDGVPLPQWRGRVEAAALVLDYKQQLLSVQPAYLRLLGAWPHHARYTGEIMSSLLVKPVGGTDEETTWSVIHFLSQENKRSGVGVRADIAAFDEPPVIEILRELRKAAHAGRRGIRIIGETPTIRRQWAPLRDDYGDTPRRTLRRINQERAEVRWSLDDVADWVLSPRDKAKLRREYAKDPLRDAREHGDYANTEGQCPFDLETLIAMAAKCRDPEMVTFPVSLEDLAGDRIKKVLDVQVEVFKHPEKGKTYYLCIDPASGVDDGRHNPACIHVTEMGSGDLCARWNGYLAPYSVGILAAGLGIQYAQAAVDIEMKDHWGVNVVRGLSACDYVNVCYETRTLRPGEMAKEIGFDMNEEARSECIGAVQEWLASWAAGMPYGECPSRPVLETLMDCHLDERGKIVAAPGIDHGEDLVCRGRSLKRAVTRSARIMPELYQPEPTLEDARRLRNKRLADLIQGKDKGDWGGELMDYREAPPW